VTREKCLGLEKEENSTERKNKEEILWPSKADNEDMILMEEKRGKR
jgi:hypothetical protein